MVEEIRDAYIENEMQSSYIDYAMSVIVGRALPDVRDGLKPAQRRILYAMYKVNNVHNQPTRKSVKIVGETIGRFHPHGDTAAYETLIRMAQPFSMNHMLVEGQGNMGSIDGDSPASMRYTEVRLRKIAEELLDDIEKESVKFIPNFDNTETEPTVLPSKVPNLLINGSTGIAVGVSTNILPHNLSEVCDAVIAYVNNKDITPIELLNYIKAPDFPTAGIIMNNSDLTRSYLTGKGSVTIRSKVKIEEGKRKQIIVNEIPYATNKSTIVERIANLVRDKKIIGITNLRDESDRNGIRIVIEIKNDVNPDYILNVLYKHTPLEVSFPVINVAVLENKLLTLNIRDFIKNFVTHRVSVIRARTDFDLRVATDRLHIVEGLVIAINNINEVTNLIKANSNIKNAREALMLKYSISEKQANAILDMKLSRLTSLESNSLTTESKTLNENISEFNKILSDEAEIYKIIKEETLDIKDRYGVERKSAIEHAGEEDIEEEDLINDEESIIVLTSKNYMKRMPSSFYKLQGRGGKGIIAIDLNEDDFVKKMISCMSKDTLLLISNFGRAYWLKGYKVPSASRQSSGKAAVNFVKMQEGEYTEEIINTREFFGKSLIMITKKGRIKRCKAESFSNPRANGIRAIKLSQGDELSGIIMSDGNSEIFVATKNGKSTRFNESDIRLMGRTASGIRGIRIVGDDEVIGILSLKNNDNVVTISEKGHGKITSIEEYRLQKRGGKGVINMKLNDKTGRVVKVLKASENESIFLINSKGLSIKIDVSSIRQTGRSASGVRLMRLDDSTKIVDAQVIEDKEGAQPIETEITS